MSSAVFTVRRRDLAWATALVVLLSGIWIARGDLSEALVPPPGEGISAVVVASGAGFPDALGAGPAGGAYGAPIILLPKDPPIPTASSNELVRLDPRQVVILGGTAAISGAMETALATLLPNATIMRLAGADRYETNVLLSAMAFPVEGWVSIPPSAFTTALPATDGASILENGAYFTGGVMRAPIQLPDRAQILELKVMAFDTDPGDGAIVALYRLDPTSGTETNIAQIVTGAAFSGGAITVLDTTIDPLELVDNGEYAYVIYAQSTSSIRKVRGVMVKYRIGPEPSP